MKRITKKMARETAEEIYDAIKGPMDKWCKKHRPWAKYTEDFSDLPPKMRYAWELIGRWHLQNKGAA